MAYLVILIVLLLSAAQAAPPKPLQARVDAIFKVWPKGNIPGCAAGVTQGAKWLAKGGYGSASIEHGVHITPNTAFYTASVSKQFTAAALVRLMDGGKVRRDDDIRKYLPELPEYDPPITIDNLIHHTSGLADYLDLLRQAKTLVNWHSVDEIIPMIGSAPTKFRAGENFSYSNTNYFLIAEIIKRTSGRSLREFARDALFIPLGMKDTRFHDDFTEVVPHFASGYWERPGGYSLAKNLFSQVGDGGLLTTIEDLRKWTRIFDDPDAIPDSPRLGERLMERGTLSDGRTIDYAYGLVIGVADDLVVAGHEGAFIGYRAMFAWIPARRVGVFALCNLGDAPMSSISNNLLYEALH